jgi:hypothetical protein
MARLGMRDLGLMFEPLMEVLSIILILNWVLMVASLVACTVKGAKGQKELGPITLWLVRGALFFAVAAVVSMAVAVFAAPINDFTDVLGIALLVAPSIIGIPLWPYYLHHTRAAKEEFPSMKEEQTGA